MFSHLHTDKVMELMNSKQKKIRINYKIVRDWHKQNHMIRDGGLVSYALLGTNILDTNVILKVLRLIRSWEHQKMACSSELRGNAPQGIILVYDITSKKSFESITIWLKE